MMRHVVWPLLGLAALVLVEAGSAQAAVQGKCPVYWLGTGDWQLREKAGGVYLVECPLPAKDWLLDENRWEWHVSAPTIQSQTGKFLASDPEGRNPSVHLVAEKGAHTRWVFEFVDRLSPGPSKEEGGRFREGPAGFTFRVKLADGPFKDWYLAAEVPKDRKEPARRRLKLVRHVKEATVFRYVETSYFVDHK
jgi:hypothetical protein